MRHLTFRFAIAFLTFVVGVAAATVWIISHKSLPQGKNEVQKDLPAVQVAQVEQRECLHSDNMESYIDALVCSPDLHLVNYIADAGADTSVLEWSKEDVAPEVRNVVELGSKAIPFLIKHLDDRRLTSATISVNDGQAQKSMPVPVGHVCLDILTQVTKAPKIFQDECGDDGMGACINSGFYFRPDDYHLEAGQLKANAIVHTTKKNWQKAYRKGWIKIDYPSWWK